MDSKRLLHAVPGKGKDTIVAIQHYLASQEVKPEQIVEASMDMPRARRLATHPASHNP